MAKQSHTECSEALQPIQDALDVLQGKWKLLIITSISLGNSRFRTIERSIPKLSSKVLAKELKDLEAHALIKRKVSDHSEVLTEYVLLPYAQTLDNVLRALRDWGNGHRKKIIGTR